MKLITKIVSITFLALLLAGSSIFATTYHVKLGVSGGSDANDGLTAGTAFEHISYAISVAAPTDTIMVYNGAYPENIIVNKALTIIGEDFANTVINGSLSISVSNVNVKQLNFNAASITVSSGSVLTGINFDYVQSNYSPGTGGYFNNTDGLVLTNCQFYSCGDHGLLITNSTNVTLSDVKAQDNGQNGPANGNGITLNGVTTANLTDCWATGNARHGLSISTNTCSDITVSGGIYSSNGTNPQGLDGSGGGINVWTSNVIMNNIHIYNAQADNNKAAGILLYSETGLSNITNVNIDPVSLTANGIAGVAVYGKSDGINITGNFDGNDLSGVVGVLVVSDSATGTSPTNVVVDSSSFTNYRPGLGSQAIALSGTILGYTRSSTEDVMAYNNNTFDSTSYYGIEQLVYHSVDDPNLGTVYFNANNLYVPYNGIIQNAITGANSGDVVNVQNGTYAGTGNNDLTIDKDISVVAEDTAGVIITPGSTDVFTVTSSATSVSIHKFSFPVSPNTNLKGVNNTSAGTVDARSNWWGSILMDSVTAHIAGASVLYDPWIGKAVTITNIDNNDVNVPLHFAGTRATLKFTYLPDGTNATVNVSQAPDAGGLPAFPAEFGNAIPLYLVITSTGLTNGTFYVTITVDVTGYSGFTSDSKVAFYNSTSGQWELVSGSYDAAAKTFTFETNHFTTFGFSSLGSTLYDLTLGNVSSYLTGSVYVPVRLNTNGNAGLNQFVGKFVYNGTKLEFLSGNIGTGTLMNSDGWVTYFESKAGSGNIDTVSVIGVSVNPTTDNGTNIFFKLRFKIIDSSAGSDTISGNSANFYANGTPDVFKVVKDTVTYTTSPVILRGDATLDGLVNQDDLNAIIDHLNGVSLLTDLAYFNAAASDNDTTSIAVSDLTYINYYISHGNTWPSAPLSIPPVSAGVTFANPKITSNGFYSLLNLPVGISNGNGSVHTLELIVTSNSSASYQYFLQDPSTLLYGKIVRDKIVDARAQGVMAQNLSVNQTRFLFSSSDGQSSIIPGKLIYSVNGSNPIITTKYRINDEKDVNGNPVFHTGPTYGVTEVDNTENTVPDKFTLSQNYPNPFNPSTIINYSLPSAELVTIKIYNILGQEVKTLVNTQRSAGTYSVTWNGDNNFGNKVSSGTYIYRIIAGNYVQTKKMILLK